MKALNLVIILRVKIYAATCWRNTRTIFNLSFDLGLFYSCGYTYVLPTVSQGEIGLGWDQLGFPVR